MKQRLLPWRPCNQHLLPSLTPFLSFPVLRTKFIQLRPNCSSLDSADTEQLTARERRKQRNENRQSNAYNWKEEVEEKLMVKRKKLTVKEMMDLDRLAELGPQWWILRVSRLDGHETAARLKRSLSMNFPDLEFKVYAPTVTVRRKLKNGSYSIKEKPIFPGMAFVRCVLNKALHDLIKEFIGVYGFIAFKVGNTRETIYKPKPVDIEKMEDIFRKGKEEQEKNEQALKEEDEIEGASNIENLDTSDVVNSVSDLKQKRQSRKTTGIASSTRKNVKLLVPGSTVRVVHGIFAEFAGRLEKLNRTTKKATIKLTLFGKESLVDLDLNDIVVETK